MSAQLGTAVVLKVNGSTIAKGKTTAINRSTNMVDVTNKSSGGNQEVLPGMRSGTYTFEGLFDESITASTGFGLLFGLQEAGTACTGVWGDTVSGHKIYTSQCYISSLQMTAPNLDAQTFSCTLTLSGAVSESTN